MLALDKYFLIFFIGISIVFLPVSTKLAFVFYGIFFIGRIVVLQLEYFYYKKWPQIATELIEVKIEEDCNFLEFIGNRGSCSYFPKIKYSYKRNGETFYSESITVLPQILRFSSKEIVEKNIREIVDKNNPIVYVHPFKEKSFLYLTKNSSFAGYYYFHLFVGGSLIILATMMTNQSPW